MRNQQNFLLTVFFSIVISPLTLAVDKVQTSPFRVEGAINSQFGIVNQKEDFRTELNSDTLYNRNSLVHSGELKFYYDNITAKDFRYGAYIALDSSASKSLKSSKNIASELKLYFQGDFGRIELGNTSSVSSSIGINSYSVAKATGGLDGDWNNWLKNGGVIGAIKDGSSEKDYSINSNYVTSPKLPGMFDENTKANKVNYFSPTMHGFLLGLSFTPDSKVKGGIDQTSGVPQNTGGGYKNIWQPTVCYKTAFNNKIKFTTAVLGEFGKAKKISYSNNDMDISNNANEKLLAKRNDLKAWQISVGFDYKGLTLAGSYGNIGESGTLEDTKNSKKNSQYWSLGSAYSTEKYGISLNYMQSKRVGILSTVNNSNNDEAIKFQEKEYNQFEVLSIGANYLFMPGFTPYVEMTKFKFKENKNFNNGGNNAKFNKGTVILAGTKIRF